ncbi:hypothetical protein K438DRAFT_1768174 [Mycena galopus ATCC 62051]|nr:hypothetical protein K438DRAFT_1768174 [Mycena galopus ATCC 62051]
MLLATSLQKQLLNTAVASSYVARPGEDLFPLSLVANNRRKAGSIRFLVEIPNRLSLNSSSSLDLTPRMRGYSTGCRLTDLNSLRSDFADVELTQIRTSSALSAGFKIHFISASTYSQLCAGLKKHFISNRRIGLFDVEPDRLRFMFETEIMYARAQASRGGGTNSSQLLEIFAFYEALEVESDFGKL